MNGVIILLDQMIKIRNTVSYGIPDRSLASITDLLSQVSGTTARWYKNRIPLYSLDIKSFIFKIKYILLLSILWVTWISEQKVLVIYILQDVFQWCIKIAVNEFHNLIYWICNWYSQNTFYLQAFLKHSFIILWTTLTTYLHIHNQYPEHSCPK